MNQLSHTQAQKYIQRSADGLLGDGERATLNEHLATCKPCRAYQASLASLEARLRQEFHKKWHSAPVPPVVHERIKTKHRRNLMLTRTSTAIKSLAGVATMAAVIAALVFVIPQLRDVGQQTKPTVGSILPTGAVTPEPVPTSFPPQPDTRLVAYSATENGNSDIFITTSEGSQPVNITNNPAYDSNPIWSPDGLRIAFESERDGNREIYVMNFDGSDIVRLTNDPANDIAPAWSPDGTRILYKNDQNGKWDLITVNIEGGDPTQLTLDSDTTPEFYSWSPDSQKVAYIINWSNNNPQINTINVDGTARQTLPPAQSPYSFSFEGWAGDSQAIYYSASGCSGDCLPLETYLYRSAIDGSQPEKIASGPASVTDWSIESERVIYVASEVAFMSTTNKGLDHWNWWQVLDGKTSKINEWPNLQEKCQQPDVLNLQIQSSGYLEQSKQMAVVVYCGKDDLSWLYLVNADGSSIESLNETGITGRVDMPHLSADGRIMFYDLYNGVNLAGSYALDIVAAANDPATSPADLAATNPRPQPVPFGLTLSLNPAPAAESAPTPQELPVSSQKDQIAYVRSEDTRSDLFVMNPDGSSQRRLTGGDIGSIFNPQWAPDGTQVLFEGWVGSESGLFLAGLDGSLVKLAADSWNAAWSPDGSQIALTTNDEVRVVGRDGSTVISAPLTKFAGEQDYWTIVNLRWTADGSAVQMLRTQNCGGYPLCESDRWWVYEMDAKTGAVHALVTSELPIVTWHDDLVIVRDEKSWQWKQNGQVISTNTPAGCATLESGPTQIGATWSPDGKWVLLVVDCYGSGSPDLYLARADGSTMRQVAKNLHMDWYTPVGWSPDGRFITFSADTDAPGNYDIYTLDLKTSDSSPVRLTNSGFNESAPVWQP